MDYRIIGTLTLAEGYTLADISDIGFTVRLSNGVVVADPTVSCEKVYSSIQGGAVTYHAGSGADTETDKYIGGEYLFALVVENAPAELDAEITPYVTYGGNAHNGAQSNVDLVQNATAPKTLSDGTKIKLIPVTDGVFPENTDKVGMAATAFTGTTKSIFDGITTVDLSEYRGMMIKITPDMDTAGMQFRFQFQLKDSNNFTDTKSAERTFYWYNGENWSATTKTAQQFTMPDKVEGYAYFEFPFIDSELNGNFSEVLTTSEVLNLKIYKPASSARIGSISEWYLIKALPE